MTLPELAQLVSPVVAAPIVRWLANTFAKQFGGRPAWWGAGFAVLLVGATVLVLAETITTEVVLQAVIFTLFAFAGAFGLNEWMAARGAIEESNRVVRGEGKRPEWRPAKASWLS